MDVSALQEDERQHQSQQREEYTYEWVHTQLVAESPAASNCRLDV